MQLVRIRIKFDQMLKHNYRVFNEELKPVKTKLDDIPTETNFD